MAVYSALRMRHNQVICKYGVSEYHIFGIPEPRPHFACSLFKFYGATTTIKGSLLVSIPITKRFSAENFQFRLNRSPKWRFFRENGV